MKHRKAKLWTCAFVFVVLALGALALAVQWGGGLGSARRGESFPQFTGSPGMRMRGAGFWGIPNPDLYAPVSSPKYVESKEADGFLKDEDRVFLIRMRDAIYVFPEVLMTYYHVVNDVVEDEPMAITFCLLAGSASCFSRRLDEKVLTLGVTGQLYCGNSVLHDDESNTDWLQVNGEPLRGHYYGRARLQSRQMERSTWRRIKTAKHVKVLAPAKEMEKYRTFYRDMQEGQLGRRVVESGAPLDPRLLPYTKGIGVLVQGEPRFYPELPNSPRRAHNDQAGGWGVLVLQGGNEDSDRIYRRYHAGKVLDFELSEGGLRDRQTGSRWNEMGECMEGPLAPARLEAPVHTEVYWFVWAALYPETLLP